MPVASDLRPGRRLESRVEKEDKQLSLFGEVARGGGGGRRPTLGGS